MGEKKISKDAMGALIEHNNPDLGFQSNVIDDAQQAASVKERMVPVSNKRETYKDWVKWGEYTQTLAEIENNENKGKRGALSVEWILVTLMSRICHVKKNLKTLKETEILNGVMKG